MVTSSYDELVFVHRLNDPKLVIDTTYRAHGGVDCCKFLDDEIVIMSYGSTLDIFNLTLEISVYRKDFQVKICSLESYQKLIYIGLSNGKVLILKLKNEEKSNLKLK